MDMPELEAIAMNLKVIAELLEEQNKINQKIADATGFIASHLDEYGKF